MVTVLVPHVGGPIVLGSPTVLTGSMPQARVGDMLVCVGPPDVIAKGSTGVFVNSMPAARMGDLTAHGGVIVIGLPTVLIGEVAGGGGGGGGGGGPDGGGGGDTPDGAGGGGQGGGGAESGAGGDEQAATMSSTNSDAMAQGLTSAAQTGAPFAQPCF